MTEPVLNEDHCYHHSPTYTDADDFHNPAEDYCVHCECCCTCLGCEYGPRDGVPMFGEGDPRAAAVIAAAERHPDGAS